MIRSLFRVHRISVLCVLVGAFYAAHLVRSCNPTAPAPKPKTDAVGLVQSWNLLHDSSRTLSFGDRARATRDRIVYRDREVPGQVVAVPEETPATIVRSFTADARMLTFDVGVGDSVIRHRIPIPRIGAVTVVGIPDASDPNRSLIVTRERRFSFAFRPGIGGAAMSNGPQFAGAISLVSWNTRDIALDAFATPGGIGPGISWAPARRLNLRLGYGLSLWPEPVHGIYAVVPFIR